ncbi:unnamed protein product [Blepharisma stoltei]|uniref:Uncharacterized protein n=1 Tax=Blepharisma stoltei TaxID=1481888 RepID=A0AAU9IBL5_9CILI|nr:unnamed protein product [Blepharisma stoltei]
MNRDHSYVRIRSAIRKLSQPVKNTINESQRIKIYSNEDKKEIKKISEYTTEGALASVKSERNLDALLKKSYTPSLSPDCISSFEKTNFSVSNSKTFKTLVSIKEPNYKSQENLLLITQNPISKKEDLDFNRIDKVFGERKQRRTARVSTLKLNVRTLKNLDKIEEDEFTGSENTFFKTPPNKIVDESRESKNSNEKIFKKKIVKAFVIDTNKEQIKIQPQEEKPERFNWINEAKNLTDVRIKIRGNIINHSQERSSAQKKQKNSEDIKSQSEKKQNSRWVWKGANGVFTK